MSSHSRTCHKALPEPIRTSEGVLIDQQQRVRNIYSVDFLHPQVLLNDSKTLLMTDHR